MTIVNNNLLLRLGSLGSRSKDPSMYVIIGIPVFRPINIWVHFIIDRTRQTIKKNPLDDFFNLDKTLNQDSDGRAKLKEPIDTILPSLIAR
jgi:hypothetical protein